MRQKILNALLSEDKTAKQIAEELNMAHTRTAGMLKELRDAGLVNGQGKRNIVYTINDKGRRILKSFKTKKMEDLYE